MLLGATTNSHYMNIKDLMNIEDYLGLDPLVENGIKNVRSDLSLVTQECYSISVLVLLMTL